MAEAQPGLVRGPRILRVFSRLNIGGPSRHVVHLTAGLASRGYTTRLVIGREAASEGDMLSFAEAHGVVPTQIPHLGREVRPYSDARALLSLIRLIRRDRPDIVHTHTAKAGLLGRLAALVVGTPIIVHTYHGHVLSGYFGPAEQALYRLIERGLTPATDCLIAVSEAVKEDLLRLGVGPRSKIRVVRLGLELGNLCARLPRGGLRETAGVPAGAPLVGIVGRLVPIKDVRTFLEAARRVGETLPQVRFAVVGDGDERRVLESRCRELGVDGAVRFCGWRMDVNQVYGDLDLVVNSSRNEGTPVALIEALAAGRPVVATRVGGTPDLLADGAYGRLVPPGDPDALASAISEVLTNPEPARARAVAGQRHVLERYTVTRLVDDVDHLYRELLAGRAPMARAHAA